MRYILLSIFCCVVTAPLAFAQVIYEPVRFQYGQKTVFYYGGHNPEIFARARANARLAEPTPLPPPVYSDDHPLWNARIFGYTAADARNAANASVPRYFRKADLTPRHSDSLLIVSPHQMLHDRCEADIKR